MVTTIFTSVLADGPKSLDIAIAVAVPGIVAPIFSYVQLSLLYELERARQAVRALSITDELTSAYNRRHFIELAHREFDRARRHSAPLSLILFDVDNFKDINDALGHLCGDKVLQLISGACQTMVRSHDIFARYGGEEFILLLPDTDSDLAGIVAERIRHLITTIHPSFAGKDVQATISIGVATLSQENIELDEILTRADRALYLAKAAGKNCVRSA